MLWCDVNTFKGEAVASGRLLSVNPISDGFDVVSCESIAYFVLGWQHVVDPSVRIASIATTILSIAPLPRQFISGRCGKGRSRHHVPPRSLISVSFRFVSFPSIRDGQ